MDSAKSHLGPEVENHFKDANTSIKIIKGGMDPFVAVSGHTHINKSFKDTLKDKWEEWFEHGDAEYTESGNRKRASYELVAE